MCDCPVFLPDRVRAGHQKPQNKRKRQSLRVPLRIPDEKVPIGAIGKPRPTYKRAIEYSLYGYRMGLDECVCEHQKTNQKNTKRPLQYEGLFEFFNGE